MDFLVSRSSNRKKTNFEVNIMEMKEQIKENTPALENQEERKKPSEALPDEDLDQVAGGVKIMRIPVGAEAAATKSYFGK